MNKLYRWDRDCDMSFNVHHYVASTSFRCHLSVGFACLYENCTVQSALKYKSIGTLVFREGVKIYDKRDDFDFDIVNFPFLDGDVPRSASYGVYISQLIRFARVSSHFEYFNTRNKV